MNNTFPNKIANLITEDPDIFQEARRPRGWETERQLEVEELEDAELLGDLMYFVKITVGMNYTEGEPMVRYYKDGSGHPGSPDQIEWEILSIDEADAFDKQGDEVTIELTDELKDNLKQALYKNLDDEMMMEHYLDTRPDPNDYEEEAYDRWKDSRYY